VLGQEPQTIEMSLMRGNVDWSGTIISLLQGQRYLYTLSTDTGLVRALAFPPKNRGGTASETIIKPKIISSAKQLIRIS
jgi:hypothetical protein